LKITLFNVKSSGNFYIVLKSEKHSYFNTLSTGFTLYQNAFMFRDFNCGVPEDAEKNRMDSTKASVCSIFFSSVMGFELRALHLLGKHSTTWDTPRPFCVGCFWNGVLLYSQVNMDCDPHFCASLCSWDDRWALLQPALVEIVSRELIAQAGLRSPYLCLPHSWDHRQNALVNGLLIEMGIFLTFCSGWLCTTILLISAPPE
jgi:hypothetical protein